MFSRRAVLLSGAGLLLGQRDDEPDRGLVVHGGSNEGAVVVLGAPRGERFPGGALDGIGARHLGSCADFQDADPVLALHPFRDHGRLWVPEATAPCRVRMPDGPSGFAVAWALPAIGVGTFVGYDPEDVASLVGRASSGEFLHLEDTGGRLALPAALRSCGAVCMTYFGEGLSLTRLNDIARGIEQVLPASADFLFTTAEWRGWSPRVMLTVFDPGTRSP